MRLTETRRSLKAALIALAGAVLILHIGFHSRYSAEYLDDAWVLSWAWNLYKNGEARDIVFGEQGGGTVHFQRTLAIVYGAAASLFGWTRGVGHGVSKVFVVTAAVLWYFIVRRLGYRKAAAGIFAGTMLLLEAYFGIANKIRPEPLGLMLCSAALLLFMNRRYLLSGLLLAVAVENHPFAFTGGFWILAYLVVLLPEMRSRPGFYLLGALRFLGGLTLGFGYWLALHPSSMGELSGLSRWSVGNVFSAYYFTHRYAWRHWPEALAALAALAVFAVRKTHRSHPFVLPFLIAVVTASLVMPRGNIHYIVYLYPAVILLILTVAEDLRITPLAVFALLIFQLPQYAWLFWMQKDYSHREHLARLQEAVPPNDEPIYGHPNAWFAFQEREFYGYGAFSRFGLPPREWPESFILIETSDYQRWYARADLERGAHIYTREELAQWTYWDGKPVGVYRLRRH